MNAILIFTIVALASPIFAEETLETKKHEKRGLLGFGYGGYGLGYGGINSYGGSGYGHGYLGGAGYGLGHGIAAAPISYSAPISASHGYSAPVISAPLHAGYSSIGFGGLSHGNIGLGHGSGYVHGW